VLHRVLNDYRGSGFLAGRLHAHSSPPPFSLQQVFSLSQSSCVSLVELTDGKGGGGGPARSQIIRPREIRTMFFLPDLFFIEKKSIGSFGNRQINIQLQYLSKLVSDIS